MFTTILQQSVELIAFITSLDGITHVAEKGKRSRGILVGDQTKLGETMTSQQKHTLSNDEGQAAIHELLQEQMRLKIRLTFKAVIEEEVNEFIQAALYQMTPERRDYRNGQDERVLVTTSGKIED